MDNVVNGGFVTSLPVASITVTLPEEVDLNQFDITEEEVTVLRNVQWKLHGQAKAMGWHKKPREFGTLIALCHSELSEALEGARKSLMDDHLTTRSMPEVELADTIIRILDIGGAYKYDVAGAIAEKSAYNRHRADHQLVNREKVGGKAF